MKGEIKRGAVALAGILSGLLVCEFPAAVSRARESCPKRADE